MSTLSKVLVTILVIVSIIVVALTGTTVLFFNEISTSFSFKDISNENSNIYYTKVEGDYYLDSFHKAKGASHNKDLQLFLNDEASRGLVALASTKITETSFTSSNLTTKNENSMLGVNYFSNSKSTLIVETSPRNRYASVGTVNLEQLGVTKKLNFLSKTIAIPATYFVNNGVNEKGLSVSFNYTSNSNENITYFNTTNCDITENILPRLILDNCSSVNDVINLMNNYDLYLSNNKHFDITVIDSSNNKLVISTQDDFYIDKHLLKVDLISSTIEDTITNDVLLSNLSSLTNELNSNYISLYNSNTSTVDYYFNGSTEVTKSIKLK